MKSLRTYLLILLPALFLLGGCIKKKTQGLPSSGGKTCEVLVVCPKNQFAGTLGDTLRAFLGQNQMGLNQGQGLFSLANIPLESFSETKMFQTMRNILIVYIDPHSEAKFEAKQNVWSKPQSIFKFTAPSSQRFYEMFAEQKNMILQAFYKNEYTRIQRTFAKTEATQVSDRIQKIFGFHFVFPEGFEIADINKRFVWVRKESKDFGQGLFVYTFPYKSEKDFSLDSIIAKRNAATAMIPGPSEGSFMTTETAQKDFYPISLPITFAGQYAIETRGLWKLKNDFMGGPFVNYIFVDPNNHERLIMIDAYLYSPRKPKRDLLLQMEAVARGIKF